MNTAEIVWRVLVLAFAAGGLYTSTRWLIHESRTVRARLESVAADLDRRITLEVSGLRADMRADIQTVHARIDAIAAPAKATVTAIRGV